MAKGKGGAPTQNKGGNPDRKNGKANKKHPLKFDAVKRQLVSEK